MLKVIEISEPEQKWQLFAEFHPKETLWVVSDLRSKLELQEALLEKFGSFESRSLLRASEFWKELLLQLKPQFSIVSSFVAETLLKEFLYETNPIEALQSKIYLQAMMQFLPVLSHPIGREQLDEWLQLDEKRKESWTPWLDRAQVAWDLLQEKNVIPQEGASSLLVDEDLNLPLGLKKIIFDLGGQLQFIESQIIKNLARHFEVEVLAPHFPLREPLNWFMNSYRELTDFSSQLIRTECIPSDYKRTGAVFERFSSPLSEVKQAVSIIEEDLRQGGSPMDWMVIFPREGQYEDMLALHFDEGGIPHNYSPRVSWYSLPWVRKWVSEMELQSRNFSSAFLEWSLFHNESSPSTNHSTFVSYLTKIYSEKEVARLPSLHSYFKEEKKQKLSTDEFLQWACRVASRSAGFEEEVLQVLSTFQKEIKVEMSLSMSHWIWIFKEFCILKKTAPAERLKGVEVVSLMSAESLVRSKKIFLGLTERHLKSDHSVPLFATEVLQLFVDLGFVISHPDSHELEFELEWLTQNPFQQSYFFTTSTERSGAAASPSLFWLAQNKDHESLSQPKLTFWDHCQRRWNKDFSHAEKKGLKRIEVENLQRGLQRDNGLWALDQIQNIDFHLSASSLESFVKCPFVFKSQKIFKLVDPIVLDLDLDPRDRGQIYHRVCEGILKEGWLDKTHTEEFEAWLETVVKTHWNTEISSLSSATLLLRLREFVKRFVAFEQDWRSEFSESSPVAFESDFEFQMDDVTIVGKIDRIDADSSGRCVLIDYKSSNADLQNVNQWLKKDKFQMAIYTKAIEEGAVRDLSPLQVAAAHYYSFYPLERGKGFVLQGESEGLVPVPSFKPAILDQDSKKSWLLQTEDKIRKHIQNIRIGHFPPIPKKELTCEKCRWRGLCRAPHLN